MRFCSFTGWQVQLNDSMKYEPFNENRFEFQIHKISHNFLQCNLSENYSQQFEVICSKSLANIYSSTTLSHNTKLVEL